MAITAGATGECRMLRQSFEPLWGDAQLKRFKATKCFGCMRLSRLKENQRRGFLEERLMLPLVQNGSCDDQNDLRLRMSMHGHRRRIRISHLRKRQTIATVWRAVDRNRGRGVLLCHNAP